MTKVQTYQKYIMMSACFVVLAFLFSASSSYAQEKAVSDPCPIPEELAGENPLDLADVQYDIDILRLCVERASLLKTLNDLVVVKTEEEKPLSKLEEATKKKAKDTLFELPENTLPDFSQKISSEDDSSKALESGDVDKKSKRQKKDKNPKIANIFGNKAKGITADIRTSDGRLYRVQVGDVINDMSVKDISTQGVVVSKEGKDIYLKWE